MEQAALKAQLAGVEDPNVLKGVLSVLLDQVAALEKRLAGLDQRSAPTKERLNVIAEKQDRLERIRHGLTELNDRMRRPYVVSAGLHAVDQVLDVLAESGDCNSVILEGEPGTGKTQWAYSKVGQELQEGRDVIIIHVRVKDTMRARDLLYSIDDVRRLSDAQTKAQIPDAIQQEAAVWKRKIVSGEVHPAKDEAYKAFRERLQAVSELGEGGKDLDYTNYVDLGPLGEAIYQSGKGKKVVLLIDEIEKGREELMTGMLDEIENLTFTIAETGQTITGDKKKLRIVITTNTEDSDKIPTSFRRRSLYHFIDYPTPADMARIVELNFPGIQKELLDYAISAFYACHENKDIQKKPSPPELLAWIRVLAKDFDGTIPEGLPHKEILLKYKEDQALDIGNIAVQTTEQVASRERPMPHFVRRALEGEKVYRFSGNLNGFYNQRRYEGFYAALEDAGVHFVTPEFRGAEGYDDDDDGRKELVSGFQVVMPGVETLGDRYYAISDEYLPLFRQVIEERVEVLPGTQKFTSVAEKTGNFTRGTFRVNGYDIEGYRIGDGRVVAPMPYRGESSEE